MRLSNVTLPSGWRFTALVALLYVIVTAWMTWPLPRYAGSAVQDPGDPLFQIWVMRSIQYRLIHAPLDLFDGNAFYPFTNVLAFSEEAISTALLAWPIYLLSGNDVLAYNLIFLFTFWLMAFAVYLLARELGAGSGAAFVAGIVAAFAPARYGHVSHLNLSSLGWFPLILWALTVYVRRGGRRYLIIAGVGLAIQLLASLHLAVFATLGLAIYLPFLIAFERRRRGWTRRDLATVAASLLIPYLLFIPTLLPHLEVGRDYGFVRERAAVERLSSSPGDYLRVFVTNRFWSRWLDTAEETRFPGAVAVIGAALALLAWRRWPVWWATILSVIAALVSFGFAVHLSGRSIPMPYTLVYDLFPPIRNIRGVGRFGLLTAIGIPLLAAFGYTAAWRRLTARLEDRARAAGLGLTALLAIVACLELRSDVGTSRVPNDPAMTAVYDWLDDQPDGPVIELPAGGLFHGPWGGGSDTLLQPIRYMYHSTRHWNPIVAGYSGFIPQAHFELIRLFDADDGGPDHVTEANVGVLRDLDVRWLVIHHEPDYDWRAAVDAANSLPGLRPAVTLERATVFEILPVERQPLAEHPGWFDLPDVVGVGAPYSAWVRFTNPNDNLTLARLDAAPDVTVTWRDAEGEMVKEETLRLPMPLALAPGDSGDLLGITAPGEPGDYTISLTTSDGTIPPVEQQVTVLEADVTSEPSPRLERIAWDQQAELRHGSTLHVEVTWRVLAPLGANYASTVQLLDANGNRVAGADLLPGGGMPQTTAWREGETITLAFALPIDPAIPPGDYQLLTAIYAYQQGYPRLPIILPDGSTAEQVVVDGLTVQP